jgi:hypothetical protein
MASPAQLTLSVRDDADEVLIDGSDALALEESAWTTDAPNVSPIVAGGVNTGTDDDFPLGIVVVVLVLIVVGVFAGLLGFRSLRTKRDAIEEAQRHDVPDRTPSSRTPPERR